MKIAIVQSNFAERQLVRALPFIGLILCLSANSAMARGVAALLWQKKPMTIEYKASCGMIYSAAEAKKDHYICPMDHSKLVPFVVQPAKAHKQAPSAVPYVQATPDAQEHELFFTPGGAYTQADIDANGKQTPIDKYRGVMPQHDLHPAKGDYICPITQTKANPKFSWVIGGKTYYFCCPPCIEEFVKQAKEHPESIRPPQDYVQK